jgi:hypothetical protein
LSHVASFVDSLRLFGLAKLLAPRCVPKTLSQFIER